MIMFMVQNEYAFEKGLLLNFPSLNMNNCMEADIVLIEYSIARMYFQVLT